MLNLYHTVKGYGEHEIVIQKSRFLAHVDRATTEEEAQSFIQEIKKKHWNATHNCSAYLIGEHDQIQKANDDGEPSGTAGVPILEVLKKKAIKKYSCCHFTLLWRHKIRSRGAYPGIWKVNF